MNDIIQDLLIDQSKNYTTPKGGHHLELNIDLNTILSAGSFILALVDFCLRERRNHNNLESSKLEEKAKETQPQEITISDEKIRLIVTTIIEKDKNGNPNAGRDLYPGRNV